MKWTKTNTLLVWLLLLLVLGYAWPTLQAL